MSFDEVEFWFGNPTVELTKGTLQLAMSQTSAEVCMLGIPTSVSLVEVCGFLARAVGDVRELRVLRSLNHREYLCAIRTRDPAATERLIKDFNGKRFNLLEEERCLLVPIFQMTLASGGSLTYEVPGTIFGQHEGHCPICLEELDGALIGVLCGHYFHWRCLEKWTDESCPVCRYHQSPPDNNECEVCSEEKQLRMCLICGNVRCVTDSMDHFRETGHTFFQDIDTRTAWDYTAQQPVHRLIWGSDKLIELGDPEVQKTRKKADAVLCECNMLLSTLLETQRLHYTQILNELDAALSDSLAVRKDALQAECAKLDQQLGKSAGLTAEVDSLQEELNIVLERNKTLAAENAELEAQLRPTEPFRATRADRSEIEALEEQLKELEFYVKAQDRLSGEAVDSMSIHYNLR